MTTPLPKTYADVIGSKDLYKDRPRVIGITGLKRSGKSTLATILGDTHIRMSFARPLKRMLKAMGLTDDELEDKETVLPRFGKTPRFLLQTLGTEWGRKMVEQNIWLNIAREEATKYLSVGQRVCFDDVRFDNEANLIHQLGGEVWHIKRGPQENTDGHVSEKGVAAHFIHRVVYNSGSCEDLAAHIRGEVGV